jgi:hypothetical protein
MPELTEWQNFYVIVGSAAGALIGLQFVVMTLIADMPGTRAEALAGGAFATPSVVHFGAVLLLAAVISAPWHEILFVAVHLGVIGFLGIVYTLVVARRMQIQHTYRPVAEDWLFHALLPFIAYAVLGATAFMAVSNVRLALFLLGGAALLLLFIGIHNAWDAITYHVFVRRNRRKEDEGNS